MLKNFLTANIAIIFLGIFLLVLSLLMLVSKISSQKMIQSNSFSTTDHPLEVYAWYPDWDEQDALTSLQSAKIQEVSPFWYKLNDSGQIVVTPSNLKDAIKELVTLRNIELLPSITNDFSADKVNSLLKQKDAWSGTADFMIKEAEVNGYRGWDLDWEELNAYDRQSFSEFVAFLASRLHEKNLKLIVTVHAQTGEEEPRDAEMAQDLNALAASADQLRIMAYDFHYDKSKPGPVTPLTDLQQVLDFANKSNLPKNKIVIALPTYGYDWSSNIGTPLQYDEILNVLEKQKIGYKLNIQEQALEASYKGMDGEHEIWFENSETLNSKIELVKKAGFYKIALWRLGGEDPLIWKML